MSGIFISYRRQDSIAIAGRIFDRLIGHFGPGEVFMDIDTIPPGVDFRQHINAGMEEARIVIALIGETWLNIQGPKGRRLDDPGDFVRIELETAFSRKIPVIPVLLGRTPIPKAEELPESIARLAYFNAAHVDMGRDFHAHCERLIRVLERHLRPGGVVAGEVLPGEPLSDLMTRYFKECDALITVSPEHTLITEPRTELIGFRNLMNSFWSIEQADGKKRPLIWILDLGRQKFDDLDSRMRFLNVQQLLSRFKALKRFDDDQTEERWRWLVSRSTIVLLDTFANRLQEEHTKRPNFLAHNVSLTTLESVWLGNSNFRELYGSNLERVRQRAFSVFFNALSSWSQISEEDTYDLRYFGYASFPIDKAKTDYRGRGLELPGLSAIYTEAFRAVCAAAAHTLGLSYSTSKPQLINGEEGMLQLHYLGYLVLGLDEFMKGY